MDVAIVRSMIEPEMNSIEFELAAGLAGPAEREFALEILRQQIDSAVAERAEIDRRLAELRDRYPGIERQN
jgi:hypothetical protein